MSAKERVVFVDRALFPGGELPIPAFEHTWSEFPATAAADLVPRVFWATCILTHDQAFDAATLTQLHKLKTLIVTGAACVDEACCAERGVRVCRLDAGDDAAARLVALLELQVAGQHAA